MERFIIEFASKDEAGSIFYISYPALGTSKEDVYNKFIAEREEANLFFNNWREERNKLEKHFNKPDYNEKRLLLNQTFDNYLANKIISYTHLTGHLSHIEKDMKILTLDEYFSKLEKKNVKKIGF